MSDRREKNQTRRGRPIRLQRLVALDHFRIATFEYRELFTAREGFIETKEDK